MPLPFLPGHDASAGAAGDDLLVAATVDGQVMVLPDGTLPTVSTLPDLEKLHIGTLHGRPVWAGELTAITDGMALPGEIAQGRWFSRAEIRELSPAELPSFPYTMSLIHRFLEA